MPQEKHVQHELIEKIRLGDHGAYKNLFYEYYPKLCWFVNRYVQSMESADEIVKELFIELWQRRERFVIHSSLKAYLYTSARNRSLNFLRANKIREQFLSTQNIENNELMLIKSNDANPSQQLEHKELETAVREAIETLPGRCKLVFTLHRDDGLTYNEIAQVMEISVKTVENQMVRALRLLRERLSSLLPIIFLISETTRNVI